MSRNDDKSALPTSVRRFSRKLVSATRLLTGVNEPESKLIDGNQVFWDNRDETSFHQNSHWRGYGPFADDSLWLDLGKKHWQLFKRAEAWSGKPNALTKIVEWGSGGGMNAFQFAPRSGQMFGVDISKDSLRECERQLEPLDVQFTPVHVKADHPEAALEAIGEDCDAFISTYVFELLPSPKYCRRILAIASRLLKPDGIALIQIRYRDSSLLSRSRGWNYKQNMTKMVSFGIEQFWYNCEQSGFEVLFIHLLPRQPELNEKRYAYFALRRRDDTPPQSETQKQQ